MSVINDPSVRSPGAGETPRRRSTWSRVNAGVGRTAPGRFLLRAANALADIEVFDRSMTLAAQAFTSLLPLIIVAAAIRHGDTQPIGQGLSQYLGLSNSATEVIERSLPVASDVLSSAPWASPSPTSGGSSS